MYLAAVTILITALAGPLYAQQNTDTTRAGNAKTSPAEADNEQSKPNAYQIFGFGDPKLDSLNKQIGYYSILMYNYDHSKKYEVLKANSSGFSKQTAAFYNNDTLRHLMARIDAIAQYFKVHTSRNLYLKRDSLGHLIGDYFKTERFITVNSRLQHKYHIDPSKTYTAADASYRQYRAELFKKMPVEVKKDIGELKELSMAVRDQLQSPQNITYLKQIPILIDSMKNYYKKPHTEQYTYASYEATMDIPADQKRKATDELMAYLKNPESHHTSDLLRDCAKQMHDYYQNTPDLKAREEVWKNELKIILADDYDDIVHPGHDLKF